jgi:hypothetical protein
MIPKVPMPSPGCRIMGEAYHAPELKNESCLEPLHGRHDFQFIMLGVAFPDDRIVR